MSSRKTLSFLNVIGELLITAGVLVLLFLAWQMWVNNAVVAASAQQAVTQDSRAWSSATPDPALAEKTDFGPPPVMRRVGVGQTIANIYIPRLGPENTRRIVESVQPTVSLNRGFYGHYPQTSLPGETGNVAIAAHRGGWGTGAKQAQLIRTGDHIYLESPQGYYAYTVRNIEYVMPTSVNILDPVPGHGATAPAGQSILTLTTCSPQDGNIERLAIYAVLDSWRPLSAGPFDELAPLMKKS
jgi:sortase A